MESPCRIKPLNCKSYGGIAHLPGSQIVDRKDKGYDAKAARFFIDKAGKKDVIWLLEKLDGSNVGVANVRGDILALTRSGYLAEESGWMQHRMFARWVKQNIEKFAAIPEGSRICGEWLAQAHGTMYNLANRSPFVAFDLIQGNHDRLPYSSLITYCDIYKVQFAPVLACNFEHGIPVAEALHLLGDTGLYGALDLAEGCVWRWERDGCEFDLKHKPILLAKYVRPEKQIGCYLTIKIDGKTAQLEPTWNLEPSNV